MVPGTSLTSVWPGSPQALEEEQRRLAAASPEPWWPPDSGWTAGGCFVCSARGIPGPGSAGDPGWAAAALVRADGTTLVAVVRGRAGYQYVPGLLALREGSLLEEAVRRLSETPDVLVVDGTGRDHPRRAGLALHLGAVLDVPSVGATHRPLLAGGLIPPDEEGAASPLRLNDELVGYWVRTRRGVRPLAVHAAWRTSPDIAAAVVLALCRGSRAPEPLRLARRAAREARAQDEA